MPGSAHADAQLRKPRIVQTREPGNTIGAKDSA